MNTVKDLREVLSGEMIRLQPAAGLESRVLQRAFRSSRAVDPRPHVRRRDKVRSPISEPVAAPRLMALVAVLIAVAVVASLVLSARALHSRAIVPVHPAPASSPQMPASDNCEAYKPAATVPIPVKAVTATTLWAAGALLSTDGGVHWHDQSPGALRQDEPAGLAKSELPPGFTDFYLDGANAWAARSFNYGSKASCYDHIVIFGTSDGGQSWHESAPIALKVGSTTPASPVQCQIDCHPPNFGFGLHMFFIDSQHGWLLADPHVGISYLYATFNGGRDWRLVSQQSLVLTCPFVFTSPSTGWLSCDSPNTGSPIPSLSETQDGGATWTTRVLPDPPEGCPCSIGLPVFFDAMHGAVRQYTGQSMYTTSDGGNTWRPLSLPSTPLSLAIDFADAHNFWDLILQPGWVRGDPAPPHDWLYHSADGGATWSVVARDTPINYPALSPLNIWPSLWFVDANHGFIIQPNDSPRLLTTSDGGHTWTGINPQVS